MSKMKTLLYQETDAVLILGAKSTYKTILPVWRNETETPPENGIIIRLITELIAKTDKDFFKLLNDKACTLEFINEDSNKGESNVTNITEFRKD